MKKGILILLVFFAATGCLYSQSAFMAGNRIAVFYPSHFDSVQTLPSLIFEHPLIPKGQAVPSQWDLVPKFGMKNGKIRVTIAYRGKVDLYGTGEVTGSLRRNNTDVELWNTDNYTYKKDKGKRLYQSHPWVMGVRKDGSAFGIIADNTWKQNFKLSNPITITSDGPAFRVVIIERDSPQKLLEALGQLTGTMKLPPLWALGYQQSRYSYFPQKRVEQLATEFRAHQVPCDVIWMDIDYMQNYKIFTFDSVGFSRPQSVNRYLHKLNFKAVYMIDPGVKKEKGYFVYDQGTAQHCWVTDSAGRTFTGKVWPGACVFPDFTNPGVRKWWGGLYSNFMTKGIDGVWNDMNEPSVFNGPDGTMPAGNRHSGGDGLPTGSHLRYHNVYGMLMVKASREGMLNVHPNKRPFILSRSNFLGGQRYAATWTGDNASSWKYLKMATPMVLNLGLSGQPFSGPDIGGFEGNSDSTLLANWMAVGAFYPFCRNHSSKNTVNQEPWAFGKRTEDVVRMAIDRRYRLLPYIYTIFQEASVTGLPVMRPVFFANPKDPKLRREDAAFLLGPDLLVVPAWAKKPALPGGIWREVSVVKGDENKGTLQAQLKLRGGTIIPLSKIIQSTEDYRTDSLTLLVSLNKNLRATGKLYVDAGDGFAYRQGKFELLHFSARQSGNTVTINCSSPDGQFPMKDPCYRIGIVTDKGTVYSDWSDRNQITVELP